MDNGIQLEGELYLMVQDRWSKNYFVLSNCSMLDRKHKRSDQTSIASVVLSRCSISEVPSREMKKSFKIVEKDAEVGGFFGYLPPTKGKTWVLGCGEEDFYKWFETISTILLPNDMPITIPRSLTSPLPNSNEKNDYDLVIHIASVQALFPDENDGHPLGWQITRKSGDQTDWTHSIVSVLGVFHRGKTFVLNLLADTELKSGDVVHTEGISFKYVSGNDSFTHVLLDTKGLDSPIGLPIMKEKRLEENDQIKHLFALHSATEYLLRDVTYQVADQIVVVVNEMTASDQMFIVQISQALAEQHQNNFRAKRVMPLVFVVHNLKSARNESQASEQWAAHVTSVFHGARTEQKRVTARNLNTGMIEDRLIQFINTGSTLHIFLADHFSQYGRQHNPFAIQLLREWLSSINPTGSFDPLEKIRTVCGTVIHRYVRNIKGFEVRNNRMVPQLEKPDEPVKLTTWQLDSTRGIIFAFDGGNQYDPKYSCGETDKVPVVLLKKAGTHSKGYVLLVNLQEISNWILYPDPVNRVLCLHGERVDVWKDHLHKPCEYNSTSQMYGKFVKLFQIPAQYEVNGFIFEHVDGVLTIFVPPWQIHNNNNIS